MIDGETTYWLAGHPDHAETLWTPARGMSYAINRAQTPQTGGGLAAPWAMRRTIDQRNQRTGVRFRVSRTLPTPSDCAAAMMAFLSQTPPHPRAGTVIYKTVHDDGISYAEETALGCVVEISTIRPTGAQSFDLDYTVWESSSSITAYYDFALITAEDGAPVTTEEGGYLTTAERLLINP